MLSSVFTHEIRVRYAEVDQQGVVFNAHYLTWVDDAMSAWLESVGFKGASWSAPDDDSASSGAAGWDFMVRHAEIDWVGSAAFGDRVTITVAPPRWGRTSFTVDYGLSVGDRDVARVVVTYVGVRRTTEGTLVAAPPPLRLVAALGDADAGLDPDGAPGD